MAASVESGTMSGSRIRIAAWSAAALLLLLPAVAMQFTDEVNWTSEDFIFAGVMFAVVGGLYELTVRVSSSSTYRAAVGLGLLACFLLVWINGAVGIIGSEDNPANLMHYAVLAIAVVGALAARGRTAWLAGTMFAAAAGFVVIAIVALALGLGAPYTTPLQILGLHGFFAALFAGSGMLFQRVAESAGGQAA
jgi:hypothetical protein